MNCLNYIDFGRQSFAFHSFKIWLHFFITSFYVNISVCVKSCYVADFYVIQDSTKEGVPACKLQFASSLKRTCKLALKMICTSTLIPMLADF